MKADAGALGQVAGDIVQQLQFHVEQVAGEQRSGFGQLIAALNVLLGNSGQVDRGALAGLDLVNRAAVHLEPADAQWLPFGVLGDRGILVQLSGHHGAGDDRAESFDGEGAVHRKAEGMVGIVTLNTGGQTGQFGAQLGHAFSGDGGDRHHGGVFQKGSLHGFPHVLRAELQQFLVHQVCAGEGDQPLADAQQVADMEVFAGLGHHSSVRRDDHQHRIHARRPRQHVVDESLVAGNVHEGDLIADIVGVMGETDVDGDAACFFLGEAVRVDAGQSLDQRRFSMIDVSGGTDDEVHEGRISVRVR